MIQYIMSGKNGRGEVVTLWRLNEYTYELEIGAGIYKKSLKFYETEYYEALDAFDEACMNYQILEEV